MNIQNDPAPRIDQPIGSNAIYDNRPKPVEPPLQFDPDNPPWGLLAAALMWAASVLLLIGMQLLFLIPYAAMHYKGDRTDAEALQRFLSTDPTSILLQILSTIPAHLLTLMVAWAIITHFGKRPFWQALGWTWGRNIGLWKSVALGIFFYLVAMALFFLFGRDEKTALQMFVESSRAASFAVAFLAFFTAPITEEVVYRGILYSALQTKMGRPGAVAVVVLLFTSVHIPQYWPNFGVIGAIAMISLALTLVRAYTGRLLPCFIIHLVYNGIQSLLLVLEPYLRRFLSEPQPQAPTAILTQMFDALIK